MGNTETLWWSRRNGQKGISFHIIQVDMRFIVLLSDFNNCMQFLLWIFSGTQYASTEAAWVRIHAVPSKKTRFGFEPFIKGALHRFATAFVSDQS